MFVRVIVLDGVLGEGDIFGRIEQAETEPRPQRGMQRLVDLLFGDPPILHRAHQRVVIRSAAKIDARLQGVGGRFLRRVDIAMSLR